jgi:hypothetical protein
MNGTKSTSAGNQTQITRFGDMRTGHCATEAKSVVVRDAASGGRTRTGQCLSLRPLPRWAIAACEELHSSERRGVLLAKQSSVTKRV